MSDFTYTVEGFDKVKLDFKKLSKKVADFRPAFQKIDKHVSLVFRRQFASEGAFGGPKWPALAPATIKGRAQSGRGRGGILRDTNRLWASLVKIGPESVRIMRSHYYERGTSVPYAMAHQEGKQRGLPKREIIPEPLPTSVVNTWEKIILNYVEGTGRS